MKPIVEKGMMIQIKVKNILEMRKSRKECVNINDSGRKMLVNDEKKDKWRKFSKILK